MFRVRLFYISAAVKNLLITIEGTMLKGETLFIENWPVHGHNDGNGLRTMNIVVLH